MKKNRKKIIIGIIVGILLVWGIWHIKIFIDNLGVEKLEYLCPISPLEHSLKYKITNKNELKIFCVAANIVSERGGRSPIWDGGYEYEEIFSDLDKYDLSKYTIFAKAAGINDSTNSTLKLDNIIIIGKLEFNIRKHITRLFNDFFMHFD